MNENGAPDGNIVMVRSVQPPETQLVAKETTRSIFSGEFKSRMAKVLSVTTGDDKVKSALVAIKFFDDGKTATIEIDARHAGRFYVDERVYTNKNHIAPPEWPRDKWRI